MIQSTQRILSASFITQVIVNFKNNVGKDICKQDCQARHPWFCKLESDCKFFKKGVCAYKHIVALTYDSKLEDLEKELKCLRNQIKILQKRTNKSK